MPQIPSPQTHLFEPAYQYSLFDSSQSEPVVNVASVPQRSPFRYPGGKTWLIPRIRQWVNSLPNKPQMLIEPFAGGGSVSLTFAFENLANCVTMVELDEHVASVWQAILGHDAEWLAERIANFNITPETARAVLECHETGKREMAFQTILKNRVVHGGILAPGSGFLKHGENGKGITSRWYPQTLKRRILDIQTIKHKIQIVQGDGLEVLRENAHRTDSIYFIDPPYTAAGKKAGTRLYTHNALDHKELFRIAETLHSPFLMTYDNTPEIIQLAHEHGFATQAIPMKNTHHVAMTELLISRDLKWL